MSYCVDKGIPHDEWLSWSVESRAKHMAYLLEQSEVCPLCGTAEWEWKDNRHAYVPKEKFCQGCYIKEAASEDAGKLPGTTIDLAPSTPRQDAEMQLMEERRAKMAQEED